MMNANLNSNDASLLSIKDLYVDYTSEGDIIHAVNGISLTLKRGKTLGLVGETGAGKTTIAKAILRILPKISSRIINGEIDFDGNDILNIPEIDMRTIRGKRISMIFQDPMTALNPVQKVGEQIAEVIKIHNAVSKPESIKIANEMLEMVGIPKIRASEYPHQFSGGMKQRVVIAIDLACNPELLLADEPTTALDVTIQAQVLNMIRKLKKELNTSMLLITHDLGVVAEICDDVAVIYAGEIVEKGSKEDVFYHPTHPYTKGLFGAMPKIDSDTELLEPILGLPPDPTNLPGGCKFHPRCPIVSEKCSKETIELQWISNEHECRCRNI
jgi:peptide/nickel transport system ATP-binding protein